MNDAGSPPLGKSLGKSLPRYVGNTCSRKLLSLQAMAGIRLAPKGCCLKPELQSSTSFLSAVPAVRRQASRTFTIEAARREPISQAQRNAELEEEAKKIDLSPHKLLEKGEPGTVQGVIKDVIPVGYFVILPNGKTGYLPALDLGFTGGIVVLERLFKVGQELTVRVVRHGGAGREILSMKKPEFAPNTDPKFIFSERGGFGKSVGTSRARQ